MGTKVESNYVLVNKFTPPPENLEFVGYGERGNEVDKPGSGEGKDGSAGGAYDLTGLDVSPTTSTSPSSHLQMNIREPL